MTKFKNTFRIESARLQNWDYSTPWWYYVTINTKNHINYFGRIINDEMILNELGKVAENEWLKTNSIRSSVELDYYIVMPNHIYGIVIIKGQEKVETHSVRLIKGEASNEQLQTKIVKNCLSDIIRGFKSSVTKHARDYGYFSFAWQSRFWDRVIRNEIELQNIRKYIKNNPVKWSMEKKTLIEI